MKKKVLVTCIILITIINAIMPVINATQIITKANLINDHKIKTHIEQENKNGWFEVICNYICYKTDKNKYPAYCIEPGIHGVDEEGDYTVTIEDLVKDKLIYNTLINGYPYRTPAQLGVETIDDAYVATKLALKSVLLNRNVREQYRALNEKGEKIINAMESIAEKGKNGSIVNKEPVISINKVGSFIESGEYYYQEYSVDAEVNISEYKIESIENLSSNYYIADINGKKKDKFISNQNFRIMIPKTDFDKDISGRINIIANCNTKPIFYGESSNSKIQDYAVTYEPYVEYKASLNINEKTNTSRIKITKEDKETSNPIEGVVFGLYKENGEEISRLQTNNNGIVIFNNLYQGTYKLKEILANEDYVKDHEVYQITTEYNKEVSRVITNTHKKGNLKIRKIDKDNNNTVLEGIEFDLIDSNNKIIAHLVTDINGEALINDINIGKYTLKETKTKEEYNLCTDSNIEVKWNETTNIKIENEKKKGQIKIVKQDKEKNEIKLEGVEFHIIDSDNKIVDRIKTNNKGEALSSRIPIGEYIIKEVDLGQNNQYILNGEEYKTIVEDEKVNQIVVENIHKKGNLKITKVDKDDKTITLGAIEFDLIDEYGNIVSHLITDVNGEVYIENINTGIYTLKETKTKREYNLCENTDIVVEWNKTTETVIENEKKKGQIKIIKQDEDREDIRLEGVKFQIIDINNSVIEEIVTDSNGEAISSKLLIGEYRVKESDMGNNTNYLLNDETYTLQVENENVTELVVKDIHKKGSLMIKKVDKDNKNIVLKGVEFEITDKDGFKYKAITNEEGIAIVEEIRIGSVKIKEIKTKENYVLNKETINAEINYNECVEITIENEQKKGQVEIYKIDKNDNNIKIPNVEFELLDKNNKIVDKIVTNEKGYAISRRVPVGIYYLKEVKSNNNYVLNEEVIKINIEQGKILKINIENEKKRGKIQIIKTSSNNSPILNIKQGQPLSEVVFEIFDSSNNIVDILITDVEGKCISKELEIGRYKVIEKSTNRYYILNTNEYFVNINKNNEVKILEIENEAVIPKLDIEKTGQEYAEKNEEIKYEFDIKNISNTKLENFIWKEYIPYEDCKITKIITGVYNDNLDYEIFYKTNQSDYKLLKTINSLTNAYINLDSLKLDKGEVITEIKVEYGTVSKDFKAKVKPCIYTKIKNNVSEGDKIINTTELVGSIEEYTVKDKSVFETIIKEKEIIKKLPKTGC